MRNDKPFGALRATTIATLCAGGLLVALSGCAAESNDGAPTPDPKKPAAADKAAEKSCGEGSCSAKVDGAKDAVKDAAEKSCGEGSCGASDDDEGDEKSCGEGSCGKK